MIDHITFGVSDFARATAFYDAAFAPLGYRRLIDVPVEQSEGVLVAGYGDDRPRLWLAEERVTRGMMHIAVAAKTPADVEAFYLAALSAGGVDHGAPGLRPHYHANYYAAFVRDPDGHNIEAVCHRP